MKKFGERIRELRKNRGLTIYELAMRLEISQNTLTIWERGEKETRIEDNPIIKSLDERVARLEKIIRVNGK